MTSLIRDLIHMDTDPQNVYNSTTDRTNSKNYHCVFWIAFVRIGSHPRQMMPNHLNRMKMILPRASLGPAEKPLVPFTKAKLPNLFFLDVARSWLTLPKLAFILSTKIGESATTKTEIKKKVPPFRLLPVPTVHGCSVYVSVCECVCVYVKVWCRAMPCGARQTYEWCSMFGRVKVFTHAWLLNSRLPFVFHFGVAAERRCVAHEMIILHNGRNGSNERTHKFKLKWSPANKKEMIKKKKEEICTCNIRIEYNMMEYNAQKQ